MCRSVKRIVKRAVEETVRKSASIASRNSVTAATRNQRTSRAKLVSRTISSHAQSPELLVNYELTVSINQSGMEIISKPHCCLIFE